MLNIELMNFKIFIDQNVLDWLDGLFLQYSWLIKDLKVLLGSIDMCSVIYVLLWHCGIIDWLSWWDLNILVLILILKSFLLNRVFIGEIVTIFISIKLHLRRIALDVILNDSQLVGISF